MSGKELRMIELSVDASESNVENLRIPDEAVYEVYRPAKPLEETIVDGRKFIRFGFTGAFGNLLLDVSSGNVVEQLQDESNVSFVNTSLEAFNRCLEAFAGKFQLGDPDDEGEAEDAEVAREIERDVIAIDPDAYVEDSFWYELRWSVAIGDFSD
jgi:hypothetical protein